VGLRDQWYENAIIYCLDVETYADSDGDGIGDFPGLTRRLDYLSGLGITCVWLMPFYPSPGQDDGYDIADYTTVDPRYGTMADFDEFILEANERGMHVIIDLVPNHTSVEHPWFQSARQGPDSPYHDYYVWRDDDPGDTSDQVVFPGRQKGIWTKDEVAGKWYLHHFYDFQPDLDFTNPAVREEFRKIIGLWLRQGVDGFRIDAAPFIIEVEGHDQEMRLGAAHQFLRELKDFATVRRGNAILLGEVDEGLSVIADYFGGGNELQALFNFILHRYMFLGLAQESADPISFGMNQLPSIPGTGQWVNFLRHHDELNLSRLTKEQRQQVFAAFGPDKNMQVYDRGLRRRLAPMLGNDQRRIRLAWSLMFSLPGAPLIYYGEEIGMGEDLGQPERMAVRTPMQWTPYDYGGFSSAPPDRLVRPILSGGEYGFERVSVGAQRGERDSLLNWMAGLTRARRECSEIGAGQSSLVETGSDAVFGIRYELDDSVLVIVNNLSGKRQTAALGLSPTEVRTATELFADRPYDPLDPDDPQVRLAPYGFQWLRAGGIY